MGCQKQGRLRRSELETTESFGTLHQLNYSHQRGHIKVPATVQNQFVYCFF